MSGPVVSVLVPSYSRPLMVEKALASLRANSRYENEIIVLSPQQDESYRKICRENGAALVDDSSRLNGRRVKSLWQVLNGGIDLARGEYACWLNDDCTVLKDWDSHAVRYFDQPDCGLVTLRTRHADGGPDFIVIPTLYGIPCANYGVMRKADGLRFDEKFSWFHGDADIALQTEFLRRKRVYGTVEPCVIHEHINDSVRAGNEKDDAARRDWLYLNSKWWSFRKLGGLRLSGIAAKTVNSAFFLAARARRLVEKIRT